MPTPEEGQLVRVRRRQFAVEGVVPSTLNGTTQHRVLLSSVEDDALGERLEVIWELELGAEVFDTIQFPRPERFDAPETLEAFLLAVRWGAASTADIKALQAPYRSGIEIEEYQLEPVARAIEMPRVNLLIADDVGLGKTIEAGLVVQELIVRHRARRVLVVCPASLLIQWRDQMRDKFGLEFRIIDTESVKLLRRERGLQANPWTSFPRLITSIDYLKRECPMKLFLERLPKENDVHFPRAWDLLIVDEAHNVAPAGRTRYIADSDRTKCIRSIARHFEHRLFLSATPHNGYLESFQALLELLDEQRFNRAYPPDPAQKQAVMVRRLKSDLPRKADGSLRFPERVIQPLVVPFDQNEMDLHAMLDRYTSLRMGELDDSGSRTESFATRFVLTLLKKRLLSSPAAFHLSLEQHVKTLRTARRRGAKPAEPTEQPSFSLLRKQVDEAEEEYDNDDRRDLSAEAALDSASLLFRPLNNEESQLLEKMRDIASAKESRADSKAKALLKWIETTMRTRGKWNDERVIVFTEYRATQNYLIELLAAEDRVLTLYGGLDKDDRERVKAAFQAPPSDSPVRILVATDAASEGLDFQNYCSRLIHYEIPWNPNRLEQRNGRVDRHGQKADKVEIFHFVSDGFDDPTRTDRLTADFRFLKTVVEKVQQIRVDLGTVGPVIASQVEQAMLGKRKELDTQPTEARAARSRAELKLELDWKKRLARLSDQLNETQHELQITPDNLRRVMAEGLRLAGQPAFEPVTMPNRPSGAWRAPQLRGSWAHCLQGLEHPYTKKPRPVVFDHDLAKNRDDVVLIHLEHPLARRALGLLRAEVWSASKDAQSSLARVTARVIPDRELKTPALIAHARLVLIGQQAQRLHEETVVVGGSYRDDLLTAVPAKTVDRLLSVATNEQPSAAVLAHLGLHFDAHAQQLGELLQGRADELAATLRKSLNERGEKEASAMQKILTDQRAAIQNKLKEWQTPQQQLRFKDFDELERDQIERDTENLRERLRRVESELKTEPASLRDRYRVATPRLFPVALTYLIPASQSGAQR